MRKALTNREAEVLRMIVNFQVEHDRSPSGSEIALRVWGIDSPNGPQKVANTLNRLKEKGYIRISRRPSIRIIEIV